MRVDVLRVCVVWVPMKRHTGAMGADYQSYQLARHIGLTTSTGHAVVTAADLFASSVEPTHATTPSNGVDILLSETCCPRRVYLSPSLCFKVVLLCSPSTIK